MSDLSERLTAWMKAANDLAKAEESCEYDRGYFLYRERNYLESMEKEFLKSLLKSLEETKKEIQEET